MNKKQPIMKKRLHIYLLLLIVLVLFLPYLWSASYAVPNADDFCIAEHLRINFDSQNHLLIGSVQAATDFYKTLATAWPFWFVEFFFNPMNSSQYHFDLYRIMMPSILLLVIISTVVLIRGVCIYCFKFEKNAKETTVMCLLTSFVFLNTLIYSEVFYWFVGAVYALYSISELLASFFIVKHFLGKNSKLEDFLMIVLGTVSAWSLVSLSTIYLVYFLFILNKLIYKKRRITVLEIITSAVFVISTILMFVGPGNYVRHNRIDANGIHFISAIRDAGYNFYRMMMSLISNPLFILLLVVGLLYGFNIGKRLIISSWILFMSYFATLLCLFGILYPVALGYSAVTAPNRIWYIFNIHAIILFLIDSVITGVYLSEVNKKVDVYIKPVAIFLIVYVFISGWYISSPYYVTLTSINTDKVIYSQWISALKQIENSSEQDIIIEVSTIPSSRTIKPVGLAYSSDSSDYWINEGVALYYEKNSVIAK